MFVLACTLGRLFFSLLAPLLAQPTTGCRHDHHHQGDGVSLSLRFIRTIIRNCSQVVGTRMGLVGRCHLGVPFPANGHCGLAVLRASCLPFRFSLWYSEPLMRECKSWRPACHCGLRHPLFNLFSFIHGGFCWAHAHWGFC